VGKNGEDKKGRRAGRQSSFGDGNPDNDPSENNTLKSTRVSIRSTVGS
jgi:hypothetical protein